MPDKITMSIPKIVRELDKMATTPEQKEVVAQAELMMNRLYNNLDNLYMEARKHGLKYKKGGY